MRGKAVFLGGAVLVACMVATLAAASTSNPHVRVGVNEAKKGPEITKKVPITRKRGNKRRSVVALKARDLGPLKRGQTLRGQAEVQVSVTCTEPTSKCVGRIYRFSPHVRAQLVLAKSGKARRGEKIGKPVKRTCSQSYPNRNHHCVLVLDRTDVVKRTCRGCSLNVVLTAWHKKARSKEYLLIGNDTSHGIKQNKASISAAVFKKDPQAVPTRRYRSRRRLVRKAPLVEGGSNTREVVLGSVRIDGLKRGEALIATAEATIGIGGLGYNVLTQGELIVSAKGRRSTSNKGVPVLTVSHNGRLATQSGYNCTQGKSDYRNPCQIKKVASAYMERSALTKPNRDKGRQVPLYVNLVGSFAAVYGKPFRSGDKVKLRKVDIRVRRIPGG